MNYHKQFGLAPIAIILIIAGVLILAGGAYFWQKSRISMPNQTACSTEAKICPDGFSVGRTGPNCEFAACPTETPIATSTITVLSPNGGEAWEIGNENIISYKGGKGDTISAMLLSENNDTIGWIFSSGSPNGTVKWDTKTVALTASGGGTKIIQPGKYKIRIMDGYGNIDTSDTPFSIVKPTVSIPNWQTYSNYGFEVQCPQFLSVIENPVTPDAYVHSVSFGNPLADQTTPGQKLVFNATIFKDYSQLQSAFRTLTLLDQGKVTIGGYQAEKLFAAKGVALQSTDVTIYVIAAKNTVLIFYGSDYSEISQNDLNTILSTFKFTN